MGRRSLASEAGSVISQGRKRTANGTFDLLPSTKAYKAIRVVASNTTDDTMSYWVRVITKYEDASDGLCGQLVEACREEDLEDMVAVMEQAIGDLPVDPLAFQRPIGDHPIASHLPRK